MFSRYIILVPVVHKRKTLILGVFGLFCGVPEPKDAVTCEMLWKYPLAAKASFFSFPNSKKHSSDYLPERIVSPAPCPPCPTPKNNMGRQHACWQALSVSRWWSRPHLYWESRSGPSHHPGWPNKKGGRWHGRRKMGLSNKIGYLQNSTARK